MRVFPESPPQVDTERGTTEHSQLPKIRSLSGREKTGGEERVLRQEGATNHLQDGKE